MLNIIEFVVAFVSSEFLLRASAVEQNEQLFVNLTPHDLNLVAVDGSEIRIPAPLRLEGDASRKVEINEVPRVEIHEEKAGGYAFEFFVSKTGKPINVPEAKKDVYYVTSALFASVAASKLDRTDFCTVRAVRKDNKIVGCSGFSAVFPPS